MAVQDQRHQENSSQIQGEDSSETASNSKKRIKRAAIAVEKDEGQ